MKTCKRCGYSWYPRGPAPKRCPNHSCSTYNWKRAGKRKYRTPKETK